MKKMRILSSILTIAMVICMLSSVVLASGWNPQPLTPTSSDDSKIGSAGKKIAGSILSVLQAICAAVVVGMLIYLGIKYMTKGAGEKASVKDSILPWIIGAILVGGASTIGNYAVNGTLWGI